MNKYDLCCLRMFPSEICIVTVILYIDHVVILRLSFKPIYFHNDFSKENMIVGESAISYVLQRAISPKNGK